MILLSRTTADGPRLAVKVPSGILTIHDARLKFSAREHRVPEDLEQAIVEPEGLNRIQHFLSSILADADCLEALICPEEKVKIACPIRPRSIICVGQNYKSHLEENCETLPEQPILFAKLQSSITAPGEPIVIPPHSEQVDYEAELAVIIGKTCKRASPEEALGYVAGYTCLNDISARDLQRMDGQWLRAKSQDTFAPFGPYLVTRDEVPDPQALHIRCWVNGELRQNSNTKYMIFPVRDLIAFISAGITLHPGDIVSTGTPGGVGSAMKPPVYLQPGDEVVMEIENVGRLSNYVRREA